LTGHGEADPTHVALLEDVLRGIDDGADQDAILCSAGVLRTLYPAFFRAGRLAAARAPAEGTIGGNRKAAAGPASRARRPRPSEERRRRRSGPPPLPRGPAAPALPRLLPRRSAGRRSSTGREEHLMETHSCSVAREPRQIADAQRVRWRVYGDEERLLPPWTG